MKGKMSVLPLLLFAAWLLTPLAPLTAAPASLLLRYEFNFQFEAPAIHVVDLIYRDGLLIETVSEEGKTTWRRCAANRETLAALSESLAVNHIGGIQAPAGCLTFSPYPTSASYYGVTLNWFGKGARVNTLEFMGESNEICPQQVGLLAADLTAFRGSLSSCTETSSPTN
jgi:hypothetical protein